MRFAGALASRVTLAVCFAGALVACSRPHAVVDAKRTPSPSATPETNSSPPPSPTATPNRFHYVVVPTPAPLSSVSPASEQERTPQILEIALNDRELSAPGPLYVRVTTSLNVTAVSARVAGRERVIPPTHAGLFEASDQLPKMPYFLKGKAYTVDFIAKTSDGRETVVSVPVLIKR